MSNPFMDGSKSHRELLAIDLGHLKAMTLPFGAVVASTKAEYDHIWFRDNAWIALIYLKMGMVKEAVRIMRALYTILIRYECKLDRCIAQGTPKEDRQLLHPLYNTYGYEFRHNGWGYRQNDAIGLILLVTAELWKRGIAVLPDDDANHRIPKKLIAYIGESAVPYWHHEHSVWEKDHQTCKPTLWCCIKGLEAIKQYLDVPEQTLQRGYEASNGLEWRFGSGYEVDLAYLYMYFPLEVHDNDGALEWVIQHLGRSHGIIRHHWDYYQAGTDGMEAEWAWGWFWASASFNYLSSLCIAKSTQAGAIGNAEKAVELAQRATGFRAKAEELLRKADELRVSPSWEIPEAYTPWKGDSGQVIYIASEQTPLSWGHAMAAWARYDLYLRPQVAVE